MILPNPPAPGTPEWQTAITASKVPAILGVSPWQSPYSLWVDMTLGRPDEEPTGPMLRGTYLENGVLDWFEHDHPELVPAGRQQAYTLGDDTTVFATTDATYRTTSGDLVIVEAKTVARDDDWRTKDGGWQIPAYYEAQVMFQLACTQATRAIVVVLTPFLEKVEVEVGRDFGLEAEIVEAVFAWQQALVDGTRPDLDDTVATYQVVRREHPDIDPLGTVELDQYLAHQWLQARADLKTITDKERGLKTRVLDAMGDAKTAYHGDLKVASRTPGARGSVTLRAHATPTDIERETHHV